MPLTDTFVVRYSDVRMIYTVGGLPDAVSDFFRQASHIIFKDLLAPFTDREELCERVHSQLARELAVFSLEDGPSAEARCARYLGVPYKMYYEGHGTPDEYFKSRVSLVELMFRSAEERAAALQQTNDALGGLLTWKPGARGRVNIKHKAVDVVAQAVHELNARFRAAGIELHYHSGHIQIQGRDLVATQVHEPFWDILRDQRWQNVQIDLKEAIDRRDTGGRDAALYAMKALESAIRIISDSRKVTRSSERGAADYIDNLVSSANGRFIDVWEADVLKLLFKHVRNPHGHGPGPGQQPQFSEHQQTWVFDSAMTWVKSLVRRTS